MSRLLWILAAGIFAMSSASALDRAKVAESLATQAAAAYAEGAFAKSAQLYSEAFNTQPDPLFLYGAARSAQLAGRLELAEQYYSKFIELGAGADSGRTATAKQRLEEIEIVRAEARAAEADASLKAASPAVAAQLFIEAWTRQKSRTEWLFKAGAAQQTAGNQDEARRLLTQYLAIAPANAPDRPQAVLRLAQLDPRGGAVEAGVKASDPGATAQKPLTGPASAPPADQVTGFNHRALGWSLLGVGVAALAAGGGVYAWAVADRSSLDKALQPNQAGAIEGLSYDEARQRADSIATRKTVGLALAAAGIVSTGIGIWQLLDGAATPPRVTAAPWLSGPGATVAVNF